MIPWLADGAPFALEMLVLGYLALLGAASGSFAGVIVARLPQLKSVVRPRSRCDGCGRTLRWFENLPLVSFVALGGRCRTCKRAIGMRSFVIEALLAVTFVALGVRFDNPYELLVWLVATTLLVALTYIDLDHFWLPDALVATLAGWGLVSAALPGRLGLVSALLGLTPALGLGVFAWGYAKLFGKEGMGLGDIKLLGAIGLFVGPAQALAVLTLACLSGAVVGTLLLLARRRAKSPAYVPPPALEGDTWQPDAHAVPFGPFLALAVLGTVLCPEVVERGHAALVEVASMLAARLF